MNDKGWEFFAHTADAKYEAYGKTLEELFKNAGLACFEVMTDTSIIKKEQSFPITIQAKRLESLLFDYLDELLFLMDTENIMVADISDIKITKEEEYALKATVYGDNHKKYDVTSDVKAITYSEMKIEQQADNSWTCTVVVDI